VRGIFFKSDFPTISDLGSNRKKKQNKKRAFSSANDLLMGRAKKLSHKVTRLSGKLTRLRMSVCTEKDVGHSALQSSHRSKDSPEDSHGWRGGSTFDQKPPAAVNGHKKQVTCKLGRLLLASKVRPPLMGVTAGSTSLPTPALQRQRNRQRQQYDHHNHRSIDRVTFDLPHCYLRAAIFSSFFTGHLRALLLSLVCPFSMRVLFSMLKIKRSRICAILAGIGISRLWPTPSILHKTLSAFA